MREWLKNLRKEKGFTMKSLGAKIGVSESYYCAIENGSRKGQLDLKMAVGLSSALGIPVDAIIAYEMQESTIEEAI